MGKKKTKVIEIIALYSKLNYLLIKASPNSRNFACDVLMLCFQKLTLIVT